uniref:Uncharacterized protein n=2 Tax=Oryza sativa subsp. japonica TaxID=39947 RepID=Q69LP1_ORYSJ|nr:hypothetical protein [Oryza sativa Japonica Group]BAD31737.1 hypothetical protein [Oryza sativa Japonica Group]
MVAAPGIKERREADSGTQLRAAAARKAGGEGERGRGGGHGGAARKRVGRPAAETEQRRRPNSIISGVNEHAQRIYAVYRGEGERSSPGREERAGGRDVLGGFDAEAGRMALSAHGETVAATGAVRRQDGVAGEEEREREDGAVWWRCSDVSVAAAAAGDEEATALRSQEHGTKGIDRGRGVVRRFCGWCESGDGVDVLGGEGGGSSGGNRTASAGWRGLAWSRWGRRGAAAASEALSPLAHQDKRESKTAVPAREKLKKEEEKEPCSIPIWVSRGKRGGELWLCVLDACALGWGDAATGHGRRPGGMARARAEQLARQKSNGASGRFGAGVTKAVEVRMAATGNREESRNGFKVDSDIGGIMTSIWRGFKEAIEFQDLISKLVFTPKFGTYGRNRGKLPKFGK